MSGRYRAGDIALRARARRERRGTSADGELRAASGTDELEVREAGECGARDRREANREWCAGVAVFCAVVVLSAVVGGVLRGCVVARKERRGTSATGELGGDAAGQWAVCEMCGKVLKDDRECEGREL